MRGLQCTVEYLLIKENVSGTRTDYVITNGTINTVIKQVPGSNEGRKLK